MGLPHVRNTAIPFISAECMWLKRFESEKELQEDLKNYDGGIELRGWLDELFGDG